MKSKYLALLIVFVLSLSVPFCALASSITESGVTVTLSADRSSYQIGDTVKLTAKVTNGSGSTIHNLFISFPTPEGCAAATGSASFTRTALDGGASAEFSSAFPITSQSVLLPVTGDSFNLPVMVVIALSSAFLGCYLFRKKKTNLLCLILAFAIASGAMSIPVSARAQNDSVHFSVTDYVAIDGKKVQVTVNVSFSANPDDTGDYGEISMRTPDSKHIIPVGDGTWYVDNEILLTFKSDVPRSQVNKFVASIGGRIVGAIEITGDYQVELDSTYSLAEIQQRAASLLSSDLVEAASPHFFYPISYDYVPNDEKWKNETWDANYPEGLNWGMQLIDAPGAWGYRSRMNPVNVGVIDSMFDTSHEDLNFIQTWNNPSTIKYYAHWISGRPAHGTHVSGTIAAMFDNGTGVAGVSPTAQLYGVSVMGTNSDSVLDNDNFLKNSWYGDKYALAQLITHQCKVINVSMDYAMEYKKAIPFDKPISTWSEIQSLSQATGEYLDPFLSKLRKNGFDFLIIESAGNQRETKDINGSLGEDAQIGAYYSHCTSNRDIILIVGAVGNNGSEGGYLWVDKVYKGVYYAGFSCAGGEVDIAAPGVNVHSTVPISNYEDSWDGTSMAAPHVTGVAAMCFAVNPSLTASQVKKIIIDSATSSVTVTTKGIGTHTYPILNARRAVEAALGKEDGNTKDHSSDGIVFGLVRDDSTSEEIAGVDVTVYSSSDGGKTMQWVSSTETSAAGDYNLILAPGTYYLMYTYNKTGYEPSEYVECVVTENEVTYMPAMLMVHVGQGTITGLAQDAITTSAVSGASVQFFQGWNNSLGQGHQVGQTTTDSNGRYSMNLPAGLYTAVFSKAGYTSAIVNVASRATPKDENASMVPMRKDADYEIVLSWGDIPADLDSHISAVLGNGQTAHTYFSNKSSSINGKEIFTLDRDDTDGRGPETTTIYLPAGKSQFRYSVHDYTNKSSSGSGALAKSNATVQVYRKGALLKVYSVPSNMTGTVWHVFDINEDGTIQTLNLFDEVSNEQYVDAEFRDE